MTSEAPARRPYRPSNGSEGSSFEARFCGTCAKWDSTETPEGYEVGCEINFRANLFDLSDGVGPELYPEEWVEVEDGLGPRCLAFELRGGTGDPRPAPRCRHTLDLFDGGKS